MQVFVTGGTGTIGSAVVAELLDAGHGVVGLARTERSERALTAVGATRGQRFVSATLPQGMPSLVGNSLYLVDTNIRAATLLGIVGGSGIGFYLTNASSLLTMHGQVTTLVLMVLVTVLLLEGIATWLRRTYR